MAKHLKSGWKNTNTVEPRPKNKMIIPGAASTSTFKTAPKVAAMKTPGEHQEVKEQQEQ